MDPIGLLARRFPLMPRRRPACTPLLQRAAHLADRARAAHRDGDPAEASAVFNLAALLASDCGMPDLARQWCHRHAILHLRARPLGARTAIRALEPLVNLARLRIRAGEGERAFHLLDTLYSAVSTRTDTTVDGLGLPAATLTTTDEAHREASKWLWATLLATGARALAVSGRWNDAHIQLRRYKGIGRRIFDGRQVAVLAHATSGDPHGALALLENTLPGEPWENAVTACLATLCHRQAQQMADQDTAAMLDRYHRLEPADGLAVFHTRLGLTVIDASGGSKHPAARDIASDLVRTAIRTRDGYTARELLIHHQRSSILTTPQNRELTDILHICALGAGALPPVLHDDLAAALNTSETVLARKLARRPAGGGN